ncbi:hypothetical protein VTJ04DRAFT_2813 [Mycothermus thermophilus]|uniref:uncharacterized protein n=1 Tax=Humicola insolens TaxID=85995 RepID=UPI0037424C2E
MSAPQEIAQELDGSDYTAAQHRVLLAQAARARATYDEIEARGIRPDVDQIVRHMNEHIPSHESKRVRIGDVTVHRIYKHDYNDDDDDDDYEDEETARQREKEEAEFNAMWESVLAENNLQNANMFLLAEFRQITCRRRHILDKVTNEWREQCKPREKKKPRFDLIASLSSNFELAVAMCKHLRPVDIVNLYSVSKDFHNALNQSMRSSVLTWARHMAPKAARVFSSHVYYRWFIPDPAFRLVTQDDVELGQPQPDHATLGVVPPLNAVEGRVRLVPGLLWLQMVVNREIRVRDILACLARRGHRMPEGAHMMLTKLWLIMDAATTHARMALLDNPDFFTNEDLLLAQMFFLKLILAFNDPIYGPGSRTLMSLMLGQRSLSSLWAMLRGFKYRTVAEIRQLKLRYDVGPGHFVGWVVDNVDGVPLEELGTVHFEGWGAGPNHLARPDELIPVEAARRELDLDRCLHEMLIWGHVDFRTGNSLVPTLDEMYMSDDDLPPADKVWKPIKRAAIHEGCGNVPFEPGMWLPKHARKARWKTLTDEERKMIIEEEEEEMAEVMEFDATRKEYDRTRMSLARMAEKMSRNKPLGAKYHILPPSAADLASQVAQFARPRRLRRISNYMDTESSFDEDAMDVDPGPSRRSVTTPGHFTNRNFRPSARGQGQQQQRRAASQSQRQSQSRHRRRHRRNDSADLSNIPDEELILEPIPREDVEAILRVARRSHRPQSETEDEVVVDEDRMDEETDYENQPVGWWFPQMHQQEEVPVQSEPPMAQQSQQPAVAGASSLNHLAAAGQDMQNVDEDEVETDIDMEDGMEDMMSGENDFHQLLLLPEDQPQEQMPPAEGDEDEDEDARVARIVREMMEERGLTPLPQPQDIFGHEVAENLPEFDDFFDQAVGDHIQDENDVVNNNDAINPATANDDDGDEGLFVSSGSEEAIDDDDNDDDDDNPPPMPLAQLLGLGLGSSGMPDAEVGNFLMNPTAYRVQPDGTVTRADDNDNEDNPTNPIPNFSSLTTTTTTTTTAGLDNEDEDQLTQASATPSSPGPDDDYDYDYDYDDDGSDSSSTGSTGSDMSLLLPIAPTMGPVGLTLDQQLALERMLTTAQLEADGTTLGEALREAERLTLDEERDEDERVRRARDWFRPW